VKDLDRFDMILQAFEYETAECRPPTDLEEFFASCEGVIIFSRVHVAHLISFHLIWPILNCPQTLSSSCSLQCRPTSFCVVTAVANWVASQCTHFRWNAVRQGEMRWDQLVWSECSLIVVNQRSVVLSLYSCCTWPWVTLKITLTILNLSEFSNLFQSS